MPLVEYQPFHLIRGSTKKGSFPLKAEATMKIVQVLLDANVIFEVRYTKWISNVVLVKKSSGKCRMCVYYTNINRVCPKDSYPLPNIDKLVDSSVGYKLLLFNVCYDYNQRYPCMSRIERKQPS